VFMSCICVIANCYLAYTGQDSPQSLTLLTGGLVGSLSAMLVKTSPTQTLHPPPVPGGTPPEVVVVNKPEDPIPTTETQNWNTAI
jgi:hypothetical protein